VWLPDKASDLTSTLERVVSGQTKGRGALRLGPSNLVWLDDLDTRRFKSNTSSCVHVEAKHYQSVFLPSSYRNSNSLQQQIHALSEPPDNVVGGAFNAGHTGTEYGPDHPEKGQTMGEFYE